MNEITRLVVGAMESQRSPKGDFTLGMESIANSLNEHGSELEVLWDRQDDPDFIRLAPTCARLLLEQSLATILGRLDPVRFISIVRGSRSADFQIGGRNPSSFNWSNDVLPANIRRGVGLWSQDTLKALVRAALDGHIADYLFGSYHEDVRDSVTDMTLGSHELPAWIISFLKIEVGEHCLSTLRKKAGECYSTLSKGMHFEFFKDHTTKPSTPEIVIAIKDSISVIATCSLYSHFTDIALQKIDRKEATQSFVALTTKFQCQ